MAALVPVEALLGSGWTAKPSSASSSPTKFVECPDLAARRPAFAAASNQVLAQGPEFDRSSPEATAQEVIAVYPTEQEASDALGTFRDAAAGDCIKSLLGRQKGAAPATAPTVQVSKWDLGATGRIGFDLAVTTATAGPQTFHVGMAFVQVGPALAAVTVFAPGPPHAINAALAERPSISDEQAAMVRHLTTSGAGIDPVIGAAGTGKTYSLDAARAAWEASGYRVISAALSARAAAELSAGSGIASTTITKLLGQLDDGALQLNERCVLAVDESGMVGTRTLDALLAHIEAAGAKLVVVGDTAQLPEIDAGGSFRALTEHLPCAQLVENRRQIHEWERYALDDLRAGRFTEAVVAYDGADRIITTDNADALRQRLVEDWVSAHLAGGDAVMIAAHRADVRDLNDRARTILDDAGLLGDPERGIDRRVQIGGREFAVGDRVLATGRNHYDLDILNGDLGVITKVTKHGVTFCCERVDAERMMPTDRLEAGHLDHSYARTNYKTQGATADRVFTLGDDGDLDRQVAYTAQSRGRVENRRYMLNPDEDAQALLDPNRAQPGRELVLDQVERELSRDRSQHQASELTPRDPLAVELLANLPEPEGRPVGVGPAARLAELPDPDPIEADLVDDVAVPVVAPPSRWGPDDGLGIDLW